MGFTDREKKLIFLFVVILVATVSFMYKRNSEPQSEQILSLYGNAVQEENTRSLPAEEDTIGSTIYVDIGGAVHKPGLYTLDKGARVKDGITAAGGALPDADMSGVNLAKKLNDEEKLYIPKQEELPSPQMATESSSSGVVSIQNGSKEELMTLPGIGDKTAEKIMEYRSAHPFTKVDDLKEVPGIGDKTFDSLKNNIQL
ncbi:comEA protein [Aedoeadaptatus nemausensis]|uniref:ComEA protein n=1 Tax=Aedoeadaptatus nemausensis TaxID=2582829 RepID=A0A6V6Y053_9FIRM|nr:ComEA family DNA-binding protein [Peptoniphilus nemausensis]CAC9925524.1 comEA protein [Peptoniphilus nemausensis]